MHDEENSIERVEKRERATQYQKILLQIEIPLIQLIGDRFCFFICVFFWNFSIGQIQIDQRRRRAGWYRHLPTTINRSSENNEYSSMLWCLFLQTDRFEQEKETNFLSLSVLKVHRVAAVDLAVYRRNEEHAIISSQSCSKHVELTPRWYVSKYCRHSDLNEPDAEWRGQVDANGFYRRPASV